MHIDSLDLIVSVYRSRNDYYKPEKAKECCITIGKQHVLKTPKSSESESNFAPNCVGYTACRFVAFRGTMLNLYAFPGGAPL